MKRILAPIVLALTFSVMFSSISFAGWKKVGSSVTGTTYYVDFERIRKHGGYVYYWQLTDKFKPDEVGDLSDKTYSQGDCNLFRHKWLDISYHTQPMGEGRPSLTGVTKGQKWRYPHPNTVIEEVLKSVCAYAK